MRNIQYPTCVDGFPLSGLDFDNPHGQWLKIVMWVISKSFIY